MSRPCRDVPNRGAYFQKTWQTGEAGLQFIMQMSCGPLGSELQIKAALFHNVQSFRSKIQKRAFLFARFSIVSPALIC